MPSIPINWDYFPFMPQIQNFAGGVLAVLLIACVIAFAGAVIVLVISKISDTTQMSQKVVSALFWILGGAAAGGATVALIGWASGVLVW